MQILRSSNLTFLLAAVIFCSMTLAMVAAAPVQASASSYGLEHQPEEILLKRVLPELSMEQLETLVEKLKAESEQAKQEALSHRRGSGGQGIYRTLVTKANVASEKVAIFEAELAAKAEAAAKAAQEWGAHLRLGPSSPPS
ncbi:hypothetical protein A4X06_0g6185 [Tilletia controversa]|uniref:Uncharacterized protein n=2 Tax=Tilletia TaxID=13289 RepID=A0A8X7MP92_9BASI|nr:hypothetical protein CF336_g5285 [Tilletia laevis]KAE8192574.1 hypothetical protein CF328_g5318 [Tilletia controversa]KAE8195805.1 hypothetical protein CF335_g5008 [Tilletia laevis]KAE8243624.1 hypothetical protein A4X06_0g6185 [Tilletia controversa]KAE8257642.1 hypothetical protein A4X03_0g4602 [Tilletia caries]